VATPGASSLGAQSEAPYAPSPVIQSVNWDFEHLIRLANTPGKGGSDLWPTTWAADGNIAKYVSATMSAAEFQRVQKLMAGCGSTTSAAVHSPQVIPVAQSSQTCALDAFIEADRAMGTRIPVQATPTYVISYKGQHLPAGSGIVSWPILKQFFDSLLAQ